MDDLPFRQVHLDFHTSPDQQPIARGFDDGCTTVRIPRIEGHAMVVFEGLRQEP